MISLQLKSEVAWLTLDRPAARNAIALAQWGEIANAVESIRTSTARLLVVTGAGGAFCAGADLSEFDRLLDDPDERVRFRCGMRHAFGAIASLSIPSLAWIDGPCFGAGVALAMACDLRVASPAARFAITPAKMGIGYPQDDIARLVRLVGPGWASRMLLTGVAIDAGTAERIGLVEEVAEAPDNAIAALCAASPASMAMLKRGIALACAGVATDADQDIQFDALLGSDELRANLSRRRAAKALPPG